MMIFDAWLPIGFNLPDGAKTRIVLFAGTNWQILETLGDGRALIAKYELAQNWIEAELINEEQFGLFNFGEQVLCEISCGPSQVICPVSHPDSPNTKEQALSFAYSLKSTRSIDAESPLQDALYIEKISRLLPTYSISSRTDDDVVLGYWLSGGVNVSAKSFRRLHQSMSWIGANQLKDIVQTAGIEVTEIIMSDMHLASPDHAETKLTMHSKEKTESHNQGITTRVFELDGRPELADFFNEHIVDIVQNRNRYKSLGIEFPAGVVLHGPPGCGKTFAVERLVDFLGWPSFQIDASSVASPYIHETSKKVAEVFDKAIQNSPSLLVIDEMEAFLADREMGSGHHRVEEVAEFLRRIPEATKNDVLIIAMTNRVDMIDPAILRRGRFDHVIKVDFASEGEILSLLEKLLSTLPKELDVDPKPLAKELAGRPLSDVTFVIREGARLAARAGKSKLDHQSLLNAMDATPARTREGGSQGRIGFI
jgi:cell division protease FtsH